LLHRLGILVSIGARFFRAAVKVRTFIGVLKNMRRKLVAGNWKMHGSRQFVQELLQDIKSGVNAFSDSVDMVVCPTSVHLPLAEGCLRDSNIGLGAQNLYVQEQGAFTGEVSAAMLAEYSVRFVIVGHSERRQLFNESNELVAEKFAVVQAHDMIPILCLGETLGQREQGSTDSVVRAQLDAVLDKVGIGAIASAVIAYEPIWAIGTGQTATPQQAQDVHAKIREHLATLDTGIGATTRILYGGSVNADNAKELFMQQDIDGGLIGGASLKAAEFTSICESAG